MQVALGLRSAHFDVNGVTFGVPTCTGHSTQPRRDPELLTLPSSSVTTSALLVTGVVNGKDTWVVSSDGGTTWSAAAEAISAAGAAFAIPTAASPSGIQGNIEGLVNGYLKNVTAGPWTSLPPKIYSLDPEGHIDITVGGMDDHSTWGVLPRKTALMAWSSGGVAHLGGNSYVATPWVWYHDTPFYSGGKLSLTCCNGSVVAYRTDNGGKTWSMVGEVANKQSLIAAGFPSEEGPNENDVVMLADGKTLLCVFRRDGGDGVPGHTHVPYVHTCYAADPSTLSTS